MNVAEPPIESIQQVLIVAKVGTQDGARIASEVGDWLRGRGLEAYYDVDTANALGVGGGLTRTDIGDDLDLAIAIGGDGTLLSVARTAVPLRIPILSVNFGSLGFLTELQPDEVFEGLEAVLRRDYVIEKRQALRVRHFRAGELQQEYALLNDAVITKSALARMITIGLSVDDEQVANYTSDGLIVSTPTGSTAYSLSAGGPILDPRMRAFVVAPICPHTMNYRPLVVPGDVRLRISLLDAGEAVYLTLDGQIGFPFEAIDKLEIDEHPNSARLIRVAHRPFFDVLRRKLRWGAR